jgi:hypothetical protein
MTGSALKHCSGDTEPGTVFAAYVHPDMTRTGVQNV